MGQNEKDRHRHSISPEPPIAEMFADTSALCRAIPATPFWQRPTTSVQRMSAVLPRHWDEVSAALRIGNAWRLKLLLGRRPQRWRSPATDSAQTPNNFHKIVQNRLALLGKESVSVGHPRHPLSGKSGDPTHAYLYHWQ